MRDPLQWSTAVLRNILINIIESMSQKDNAYVKLIFKYLSNSVVSVF